MNVLAINMGSSSLKVAFFAVGVRGETCLARGVVGSIGAAAGGRLELRDGEGRSLVDRDLHVPDPVTAFQTALDGLDGVSLPPADAIGHRLVHGGPTPHAPVPVDALRCRAATAEVVPPPLYEAWVRLRPDETTRSIVGRFLHTKANSIEVF